MEKKQEEILAHYLNGSYTREEAETQLEAFRNMSSDADVEVLNRKAAEIWMDAQQEQKPSDATFDQYRQEAYALLAKKTPKSHAVSLYRWMAGAAACLLLCVGLSLFIHEPAVRASSFLSVTTTYGQTREVLLPDGTSVLLNACSTLEYPATFEGNTRSIRMKGEGFFRVVPNKEKPFMIHTDRFQVKVLGTVFSVKNYAYDETLGVEVESGKVEVKLPDAMMRLTANERMSMNRSSGDFMKEKNTHEVAPWRNGFFYFSNMPIQDVAKDLERHYGCKIYFEQGQSFTNHLTGKHEIRSLEEVLQSIGFVTALTYRRMGNTITLYK